MASDTRADAEVGIPDVTVPLASTLRRELRDGAGAGERRAAGESGDHGQNGGEGDPAERDLDLQRQPPPATVGRRDSRASGGERQVRADRLRADRRAVRGPW